MKVLIALLVGAASGALAVRTLRPGPVAPSRPGPDPAAAIADPGARRVPVDVSAFTD